MDPITAKLMSAAGAAEEATYVDDVFSTFLYEGTGSAQTITNGIDLSGEGGLVWIKSRNNSYDYRLTDTERGLGKALESNSSDAEATTAHCVNGSFNSDGFSLSNTGTPSAVNTSGDSICSWTFRKCPGFFDVVTYTGNDTSGRTISHNLGSVPGSIWVKNLNGTMNWTVYHRGTDSSAPEDYVLFLNNTSLKANRSDFADTAPTASVFSVGSDDYTNGGGNTYVAYLFAHDDQSFGDDGDEAIIKCGSFTASAGSPHTVTVGFEPQWVIIKRTTNIGNWTILDNMRGWVADTSSDSTKRLMADYVEEDEGVADMSGLTSTGFTVDDGAITYGSNEDYVYIAIRRSHKPPTDADDVFDIDTFSGSGSAEVISTTFTVDANLTAWRNRTYWPTLIDRLRGGPKEVYTENANDEYTNNTPAKFDFQTGLRLYDYSGDTGYNLVSYSFKRAPGFFDVVAYTGNGTNFRDVTHNLSVTPEMIWVKNRDRVSDWIVWHKDFSSAADSYINLNLGSTVGASTDMWGDGLHTSTTFELGLQNSVNRSGDNLIAYLFASKAGISKVGTYSGTGNDVNVDCGFTAGARFVLIKRTDASGDWYVWDTARGIVSGNDEYLLLNEGGDNTATNTDYIDPLNSGFTVTSSAPAALNASGGTYIFFAIA